MWQYPDVTSVDSENDFSLFFDNIKVQKLKKHNSTYFVGQRFNKPFFNVVKFLLVRNFWTKKLKDGSHQRMVDEKELEVSKTFKNDVTMMKKFQKRDCLNFSIETTSFKGKTTHTHTHKTLILDFIYTYFFTITTRLLMPKYSRYLGTTCRFFTFSSVKIC